MKKLTNFQSALIAMAIKPKQTNLVGAKLAMDIHARREMAKRQKEVKEANAKIKAAKAMKTVGKGWNAKAQKYPVNYGMSASLEKKLDYLVKEAWNGQETPEIEMSRDQFGSLGNIPKVKVRARNGNDEGKAQILETMMNEMIENQYLSSQMPVFTTEDWKSSWKSSEMKVMKPYYPKGLDTF